MRHPLYRAKMQHGKSGSEAYCALDAPMSMFSYMNLVPLEFESTSLLSNDHDTFGLEEFAEMVSSCLTWFPRGKTLGPSAASSLTGRFRAAEKGFHLSASPFFLILNTARLGTVPPGFVDV